MLYLSYVALSVCQQRTSYRPLIQISFPKVRTYAVFQILDHCGIFLFIAASYTPIIMFSECSFYTRLSVLFTEWVLAIVGMVSFILAAYFKRFQRYYSVIEPVVCLVMGWMIVLNWESTGAKMSSHSSTLLVTGGLLYTFGIPFLIMDWYYGGIFSGFFSEGFRDVVETCREARLLLVRSTHGWAATTRMAEVHKDTRTIAERGVPRNYRQQQIPLKKCA